MLKAIKQAVVTSVPVKAGAVIKNGEGVGIRNTGYAERYVPADYAQYNFVTIAASEIDNTNKTDGYINETGGERYINIYNKGTIAIVKTVEAFQQSDVGNVCYLGNGGAKRTSSGAGDKVLGRVLNVLSSNAIEIILP